MLQDYTSDQKPKQYAVTNAVESLSLATKAQ